MYSQSPNNSFPGTPVTGPSSGILQATELPGELPLFPAGVSEKKVLRHVPVCVTLWTIALQAPLSMEFFRQEYWSGLPCPPARDLPNPGIEPTSPALQADFLPPEPPCKPHSLPIPL